MLTRRGCAHRFVGWSLLAGLVLGSWFAGPAARADGTDAKLSATSSPDQPATTMPDGPDFGAATPKALIESMAKTITLQDKPGAWEGFQSPANRPLVKTQLELAAQLSARGKAVADLVQAKIGKMEAGMVRGSAGGGVQSGSEMILRNQLSQIAPARQVDWSQVKIAEAGDKAQAVISNNGGTIYLAKANDKWYLGEGVGPASLAQDIQGAKKMTAAMMKILDLVEQKVKAGQITKRNFIQEYSNILNENMGAAM